MSALYIVIPALEPGPEFPVYVESLLEQIPGWVLVVDDGSGQMAAPVFEAVADMEHCRVLTHKENKGKGRALKTAFAAIKEQGVLPCRVICADCDGQHAVEDIVRMADFLRITPGSLVLGCRKFSFGKVPFRSWIGNRATSFLFWLLCGRWFADTQTGLRGMDGSLLELMGEIPGERFEYEMYVLLYCMRTGIPIKEREIETIYREQNAASHFRPLRDSWMVLSALLSGFFRFLFSSFVCAGVDVAGFVILLHGLEQNGSFPFALSVWIATLTARGVSALLNYWLNRTLVFENTRTERSAIRYGLLCAANGIVSAVLVSAAGSLGVAPGAAKIVCDGALFLVSYQMQNRWVFPGGRGEKDAR